MINEDLILLGLTLFSDPCTEPLGMQDERIQDYQITSSSDYNGNANIYGAHRARLDGNSCWIAADITNNQLIQVDFGDAPNYVSGVVLQSCPYNEWVTKYRVLYRTDSRTWQFIKDDQGNNMVSSRIYCVERNWKIGKLYHKYVLTFTTRVQGHKQ